MKTREMITGTILGASLLNIAGCSNGGPKEYDSISTCYNDGTNVEPTYIPGQAGYSERTDPNVLAHYQKSLGKDWGVGMVVCDQVVARGWDGGINKTKQVLTQTGVQLSSRMPTQLH